MSSLHVERIGAGPPVLLVHGSVSGGAATWGDQRVLAERYTLLIADRPGYGRTPMVEREDFDADAPLVADALGDVAHLVGHSYGGVVSLLAAAQRPEAVRSLTVIEPPAFGMARGNPEVEDLVRRLQEHWQKAPQDPESFLRGFLGIVGSTADPPSRYHPSSSAELECCWSSVPPGRPRSLFRTWPLPLFPSSSSRARTTPPSTPSATSSKRSSAPSGPSSPAPHSVQRTGAPFNRRLEEFLSRAD